MHPFNISTKGIGFIHAGYLHSGSKCQLSLRDADDGTVEVAGTVTSCTLLKGTVHRVGVEFEMPLDVDRILKPGGSSRSLTGRLLVIDQSEPARSLLAHDLSSTAIDVAGFARASEALEYLRTKPVTRVISDAATIRDEVETTMLAIREGDYRGPVLLMASDPKSHAVQAATKMGAGPLLTKPFDVDELLRFVGDNWASGDEEVLEAESPECALAGLIENYVGQVASLIVDLDAATLSADYDRTLQVVQHLKGDGTTFGFPDLTTAASAAVTALHASGDIPEAAEELRWLREVCSHLQPEQSERLRIADP